MTVETRHISENNYKNSHKSRFIIMLMLASLPLIASVAPRALASIIPALGVLIVLWEIASQKTWPKINYRPLFFILPVLALGFVSSLWAIDPNFALERCGKMTLVLIPGALLFGILLRKNKDFFQGFEILFLSSCTLALLFNISELYFEGVVYQILHDPKDGIDFKYSWINRSLVALILCAPAALIGMELLTQSSRQKIVTRTVAILLLGLLSFLTYSQSTHLALGIMALTFFLFPMRWKWSWSTLILIIAALIISTPFLAQILFQTLPPYFEGVSWFEHSYAAARLEIWDYVSRYALQSPWIGHGIEATRAVQEFNTQELYYKGKTVLHPHNFSVQIWMEFGLLGATVFSFLLMFFLQNIRSGHQTILAARLYLTTVMGCMAVASTGYGLWQGWWLGTFLMAGIYSVIIGKRLQTTEE